MFALEEKIRQALITRNRSLLVGIAGPQGSGKSTLALALAHELQKQGIETVTVSLDDFYYTRTQRKQLAETLHPLLATRGVQRSYGRNSKKASMIGTTNRIRSFSVNTRVPAW